MLLSLLLQASSSSLSSHSFQLPLSHVSLSTIFFPALLSLLSVLTSCIRQVKAPDSAASRLFYLPHHLPHHLAHKDNALHLSLSFSSSTQHFSTFTSLSFTLPIPLHHSYHILSLSPLHPLSTTIIYGRLIDGILILFSLSFLLPFFLLLQLQEYIFFSQPCCTSAPSPIFIFFIFFLSLFSPSSFPSPLSLSL